MLLFASMNKKRNPHAVALGRKGGLKGGPARWANLTPEERSALASKMGKASAEAKALRKNKT